MSSLGAAKVGGTMPYYGKETYAVVVMILAKAYANLDDKSILNTKQDFNFGPGYRLTRITRTDKLGEPSHILLSVYYDYDNSSTVMVQFYLETCYYYHGYKCGLDDPNFSSGLIYAFEVFLNAIKDFYKLVIINDRSYIINDRS